MKIVRTQAFLKCLKKLGATKADLAALEDEIAASPAKGDVVPGLGGVRKIRFAMKGRGKSGGGRALYYVLWVQDTAYLLLAYSKNVQEDLSESQRIAIRSLVKELDDGEK